MTLTEDLTEAARFVGVRCIIIDSETDIEKLPPFLQLFPQAANIKEDHP